MLETRANWLGENPKEIELKPHFLEVGLTQFVNMVSGSILRFPSCTLPYVLVLGLAPLQRLSRKGGSDQGKMGQDQQQRRPPVPRFDRSSNPDAPTDANIPAYSALQPRSVSGSLPMMTPRSVASSHSQAVMTPRAGMSQHHKAQTISRTRIISGPSKSHKEKSLFDSGYQDRAAERRQQEDAASSKFVLDFKELDSKRQELMQEQEPYYEEVIDMEEYSEQSLAILKAMGLMKKEDQGKPESIWELGRATLTFDFKRLGPLPQIQIRSRSETEAMGCRKKSSQQIDLETALINTIAAALHPESVKTTDQPKTGQTEDDFDMFADDTDGHKLETSTMSHKDRMKKVEFKRTDEAVPVPAAVQSLIQNIQPETEEIEITPDGYEECYPGVYETAGVEFDSEGEEDSPGTKRKSAALEQRQSKRRLDRETAQVERIMQDKYGN